MAGFKFNADAVKRISDSVRLTEGLASDQTRGANIRPVLSSNSISVVNDDVTTAPRFGIAELGTYNNTTFRYSIIRPTFDNVLSIAIVKAPVESLRQVKAHVQSGQPFRLLCSDFADLVEGDLVGTQADSWFAAKSFSGNIEIIGIVQDDLQPTGFPAGVGLVWGMLKTSGENRWKQVFAINPTAPSTSTITTTEDLTTIIKVGSPVKFITTDAISGSGSGSSADIVEVFYAMVTAVTSNLITISGAPLSTAAGQLLAVFVGEPELVAMLSMFVSGTYADGLDDDLLATDMLSPFKWMQSKYHLVRVSAVQMTVDTGTEPSINVQINNTDVLTTDIQLGASGTWIDNSAVAFDTDAYDANLDEEIEVACTVAGGTGDASDLTVQCYWVAE